MKDLFSVPAGRHGQGPVKFAWDRRGRRLASCGSTRQVLIHNRAGELQGEFTLRGKGEVRQLEWNADGETLAVLQDGCQDVALFEAPSKSLEWLQTSTAPTFLCWGRSESSPLLAVGGSKGGLLVYNARTRARTAVGGKHGKAITCGMWSLDDRLALGGADKTVTVSDSAGGTLRQEQLASEPHDLQFADQKLDAAAPGRARERTVSINLARRSILLYALEGDDTPVEVAFQQRYGSVVSYSWHGDGYVLAGFSRGFVVSISTHMKEIGEELHSVRAHAGTLHAVAHSAALGQFATAGDEGLRVTSTDTWAEVPGSHRPFHGETPQSLQWTADGQILTVSTSAGNLYAYLASIPAISASHGGTLAYLSSLRSARLVSAAGRDGGHRPLGEVALEVEPTLMALGPGLLAAGMNNRVWYYAAREEAAGLESRLVAAREYVGSVRQVAVNGTHAAALLADGRLHLHEAGAGPEGTRVLPEQGVTCVAVTAAGFVVYGTRGGTVHYATLDGTPVSEFRLPSGSAVAGVYPNASGTRVVVVDAARGGAVYSPVDDHCVAVEKLPKSCDGVVWDHADPGVFVAADVRAHRSLVTYLYRAQTVRGPTVQQVAVTRVADGFRPGLVRGGVALGQNAAGAVSPVTLSSHDAVVNPAAAATRAAFHQFLALARLREAWAAALELRAADAWEALARRALEQLDVELALRVYRQQGNVAMVHALLRLQGVEDKHLLAGHVQLLFGDYDAAQALFLRSGRPTAALDMRRDLRQWDHALRLAGALAPGQVPAICVEYGQQREFRGEHAGALEMFRRGTQAAEEAEREDEALLAQCRAGVARATIRTGDVARGRDMAARSGDRALMRDCAAILEQARHLAEAADLYRRAEAHERAAALFIQLKDFGSAAPLMERITTPKLHAQYAKAKEAEGSYAQAADAYERAKDYDSVVRLCLTRLNEPARAFDIARRTRSAEAAGLVAQFAIERGEFQAAIEFLLMTRRAKEALALAREHGQMDAYAAALGRDGTPEDYLDIALHFEELEEWARAAEFQARAGRPRAAVRHYLRCGEERLGDAIEVVRANRGHPDAEVLVRLLHDYLVGEQDGRVKDPKYIYRLYVAIGDYAQAGPTAVLIAEQEQRLGNYKVAHGTLLESHQDLVRNGHPVPEELRRRLLLLHSYVLVKRLVKRGDHAGAARMLMRVANSVSRFPKHVVQILMSAVIECQRAGLKRSSFDYASMLMRPEYRAQVDERYRRNVEQIVRRRPQEEREERSSPCPICRFQVPGSLLDCPGCRNALPYCVASGRHVEAPGCVACPHCRFPAIRTEMLAHLASEHACPMCEKALDASSLEEVDDVGAFLRGKAREGKEEQFPQQQQGEERGEVEGAVPVL